MYYMLVLKSGIHTWKWRPVALSMLPFFVDVRDSKNENCGRCDVKRFLRVRLFFRQSRMSAPSFCEANPIEKAEEKRILWRSERVSGETIHSKHGERL